MPPHPALLLHILGGNTSISFRNLSSILHSRYIVLNIFSDRYQCQNGILSLNHKNTDRGFYISIFEMEQFMQYNIIDAVLELQNGSSHCINFTKTYTMFISSWHFGVSRI